MKCVLSLIITATLFGKLIAYVCSHVIAGCRKKEMLLFTFRWSY